MKPAIDISDDQWAVLIGLIRRFLPDTEVWAHGSRAKWTARPNSDLDLVAFCTHLDRRPLSQLKDALAESSLPFVVDLLVWDDVPVRFHDNIRGNHVVIQEAAQQRNTFSQHGRWAVRQVEELMRAGVLVIGDGYRAKNSELSTAGIPFARAGNINNGFDFSDADRFPEAELERVGNKISQPGDVVFTSKGTVGRFAYVRPETPRFVYSPQLCFWRSAKPAVLDPRFLYYWMLGREFYVQFKGVSGQTDMAEYVSLTDQRRMYLTLPPTIAEQRAIASILGALDDKIESNRRTSRALERVARALFRAWFVDFEPVRAKAAGAREFPGMPPETFAALPSRLVPSELGPIPEGWRVGELRDIAELSRDTINPQEHPEETFDHLSIPAFDDSQRPACEPGAAIKSNKFLVAKECILVSKLNPRIPRVWLPPAMEQRRQIASTEFLVTTPRPGWSIALLFCLVQQQEFVEQFAQCATGTSNSHQRVKPNDFIGSKLALPSQLIAESFSHIAWPLLDRSRVTRCESLRLATLRDYLLPKLLSGAVRATGKESLQVRSGGVPA